MSYYTIEEKAMTSFFNKKNAPRHIEKRTTTKYGSMSISELKEQGMWNSRLEKITPYLPKDAWIAGGFLRSVIGGEDELGGDIDFFFHTEEAFNKTLDLIKYPTSVPGADKVFNYYNIPAYDSINKLRIVDCESLASFRPNIQLVRLYWFDSPEHVIDSFDFTVCQFITDGKTLWFGPHSFEDVKTKTLRHHRETGDAIAVLNRILKYQNKGYRIEPELFELAEKDAIKILSNPDEISQYFYKDQVESDIHKHEGSFLQRAWDYLETAPASAAVYAKAMKKRKPIEKKSEKKMYIPVDAPVQRNYSWDGS